MKTLADALPLLHRGRAPSEALADADLRQVFGWAEGVLSDLVGRTGSHRKLSSSRASANSWADLKRSAGSFSMDLVTTAATWAGTVRRRSVRGRASSVRIRTRMDCAVGPV